VRGAHQRSDVGEHVDALEQISADVHVRLHRLEAVLPEALSLSGFFVF
jgi:hypothetical protein